MRAGFNGRGSVGAAGLKCGDERQAYLFDDRGGAFGRQDGFGGGKVGGERAVAEDAGYPAGEVVAGAVVAQDAPVAADQLGFQFGEVGGDRPGGGVGLGPGSRTGGRARRRTGRTCARAADGE